MGLIVVLYRRLLRLYPSEFRKETETALIADLRHRLRDRPGWAAKVRFTLRELTDLLANLPGAHMDARAEATAGKGRPIVIGSIMDRIGQDLAYALRSVRAHPGFATVVVVTLGLGIGANAAVFGIVNGVVLDPLPYRDAGQLVYMYESYKGDQTRSVSWLNFQDWRARNRTFQDLGARTGWNFTMTSDGPAEILSGLIVSANLFPLLGVEPVLGRSFTEDEERREDHVLLLSAALWAGRFGSDTALLGQTLTLNDEPWTVIGVMPAGLEFPIEADVYAPLTTLGDGDQYRRSSHPGISVIGRLAAGTTLAAAQEDMDRVASAMAVEYPDADGEGGVIVRMLRERYLGSAWHVLTPLVGAVTLVFLLVCANVANLFLVRGQGRRREAAVRTALGGGRARIARTYLTEAGLLSAAGALLGVVLAYGGVGLLKQLSATGVPRLARAQVDGTVLLFAAGASVLATLLVGVLPALRLSSVDPARELVDGGARGHTALGGRLRAGLVVVEVGICFVLLVASGLMLRSMANLGDQDPGFDPSGLLTIGLRVPPSRYQSVAERARFVDRVLERVASLPGVTGVAHGDPLPMDGNSRQRTAVGAQPNAVGEAGLRSDWYSVTPGYFALMGMRFVEGGPFDDHVRPEAPSVVVDRTFADRFWPGETAVGRLVRFGSDSIWSTVVGVVTHVHAYGPRVEGREQLYVPHSIHMSGQTLVIRSSRDPTDLAAEVRAAVAEVDPQVPIRQVATMTSLMEEAVAGETLATRVLGLFSAAALGLAMLGLYGVVSYSVGLRSREIGIRMALGARSIAVLRRVAGGGVGLAALGIALGGAGALATTQLLGALLYGVEPLDGATLAVVALALLAVSVFATLLPARRASRVDPAEVLKAE